MSKGSLNLQDSFLNQVRRESILVRFTLLDGREFRGRVKGFDNFTVVVVGETNEYHLIYKHAIGQIVSPKPIHGTTARKGGPAAEGEEQGREEQEPGGATDTHQPEETSHEAGQQGHTENVGGREPKDSRRKSGFNPIRLDQIKVRKENPGE